MTLKYMDFECMTCGKMFERRWFDIGRSYERVHFRSPGAPDEVEVADAEGIGVFCSQSCLDAGRAGLMKKQGVPIPSIRPGIGPVEQCAKCEGPVDMSAWHLTHTDGEYQEEPGFVRSIDFDYLAVVCRKCSPRFQSSALARDAGDQDSPDTALTKILAETQ